MKTILSANTLTGPSTTTTQYNFVNTSARTWNTTETNFQSPTPIAGTVTDLYVMVSTAPGAAKTRTFTLMLNGVAQTLTVSLTGTGTGNGITYATDSAHPITVAAGDLISLRSTVAGTPAATGQIWWAMTIDGSVAGESALVGGVEATITTVQRYNSMTGGGAWAANIGNFSAPFPTGGTISNLYVALSVAPGAAKTRTITVNVNGTDTALTVGITGAGTTTGNDTTHSVSVSAGDKIVINNTTSGSPATSIVKWACRFVPTTDGESVWMSGTSNPVDSSFTFYGQFTTPGLSWTNDTDAQLILPVAVTLKKYVIYVTTAPGGGGSYAQAVRKNGTNTSIGFTLSGSNTTASDNSNTDSASAGDLINVESVPSGTPTGSSENGIGLVLYISQAAAFLAAKNPIPRQAVMRAALW